MKLLIAYVGPQLVNQVLSRLQLIGVGHASVVPVQQACQPDPGLAMQYRGVTRELPTQSRCRLEVIVADGQEEKALDAIRTAFRTQATDDDRILAIDLAYTVHARSGAREPGRHEALLAV